MRKRVIPNVDRFSASEIQDVCGMPPRSMEYLKREKLSPTSMREGGRGQVVLYDFNALCFFAATGALLKVSSSIAFAARLAKALIDELTDTYGQAPFGRAEFDRTIRHKNLVTPELFDADGNVIPLAVLKVIRDNPELYTQGTVLPSDFKILILNGQHVLSATRSDIPVTPGVKLDGKWWSPELILETANRGSEVSVVHLHDYLSGDFERANPEFIAAYDQAETKVEINLSLPVRNALDAICSIRMGVAGHIGKRS